MASDSYVMCKICNCSMRDPRMLTCFHSFCLKCLESSSVAKESKCPTCQIKFEMPRGGMNYLKKCELIEIVSNPKIDIAKCDSCKENQAINFCVDCSFNYCSTCLKYHGIIPSSRNHQLQSSTSSQSGIKNYSTCKDHSEAITLFCEDCKAVSCGRCFTLKHSTHKVKHITDYFDSVKQTLEQNIKQSEEVLRNVVSNCRSSEFMKSANQIKVSLLNKEIQQRGADLKKEVDLIISELITDVDEKFQERQKEGKDVLKELKSMETDLSAEIQTMKEQQKILNYENVSQASLEIAERKKEVPKYCDDFNFFLLFDHQKQIQNLENVFGNLGKGKLKPSKESTFQSIFLNFAIHHGNVFVSHIQKPLIHTFDCSESTVRTATCSMSKGFEIHDLLVIGDVLFVSGLSNSERCQVIKVSLPLGKSKQTPIYSCSAEDSSVTMRMSRSASGNILAAYSCYLLHLSGSGVVLKKIFYDYRKLMIPVRAALQLKDQHHVVLCCGQISIIDDHGCDVAVYSHSNKSFEIDMPVCMVKDKHENIYVYNLNTHYIFVLDCCLRFKACYEFGQRIHKMIYDQEMHKLMVLSDRCLSTFDL